MKKISGWFLALVTAAVSLAAMLVFVGYHFFVNIGSAVAFYTEGLTGLGKFLMFLKAAKETFLYVRSEFIWIYKIGFNSMILTIISMFVTPETGV